MNRIINIHTTQGRRLQNVIIRNKINLIDPILLMCPCRINRMRFIHLQMLSQIYASLSACVMMIRNSLMM